MRQVNSTDFKTHLDEFLDEIHDGPIIVNRLGKPAAVLLSVAEYDLLRRLDDRPSKKT